MVLPACGANHRPANTSQEAKLASAPPEDLPLNPPEAAYLIEEDAVQIPPRKRRRETASSADTIVEPSTRRSAAREPAWTDSRREMPGTARINEAPIFARSAIPLSKYNIEQGTSQEALEAKQRILDALAGAAELPNDGAAVTVITKGDKAILFGLMKDAREQKLVEDIARENARRVESHLTVSGE